jgi:histidine triad (HIT) family protein
MGRGGDCDTLKILSLRMNLDPTCPFCRIATGQDDTVAIVCESTDWVASFPDSPATHGHTLLIPRSHVPNLWEADRAMASRLMSGAVLVGRAIMEVVQPQGMNLITSAGSVAEQSVPHLHLHLVPRWEGDRIDRIWPDKVGTDAKSLGSLASRIRHVCSATHEPWNRQS